MKYPDLLKDDMARVGIRESRKYNIVAGILITDMVKTSLGPRGMEKVLIDIQGDATITKHGGAFLRKIDVDHPAAKAVIEAVNTVDTHVGDGTTATAILIGALLKQAEAMLKLGIKPSVITRGYEISLEFSLAMLDSLKRRSSITDRKILYHLAVSCLKGKAITNIAEDVPIAESIVEAVCAITNFREGKIDVDDIKIEEKAGNSTEIQLIRGTVVDKTIDHADMPRSLNDARILLLNEDLEPMQTKNEAEITITSPEQMSQFLNQESADIREKVGHIVDSKANVVISRKGIDLTAQEALAKNGIISMRRVKYNDIWWLEKSTGAKTCKSLENISPGELGLAKKVYEKTVGGDKMIFFEGCGKPKSVTLLLRANSKRYLDEFHRSALNAIYVLRNFIEEPFLVRGGGSTEAILAQKIRTKALMVAGREQIAIQRFADALEEIPMTLAGNVGMDYFDTLTQLRAKHAKFTNGEFRWIGIDSNARKISDIPPEVIEPIVVKRQMITTAVEATNLILNVDDVFMQDLIDNTHCHIDGTVHAHHDGGKAHNHFEQEGLEQRQMHHYY